MTLLWERRGRGSRGGHGREHGRGYGRGPGLGARHGRGLGLEAGRGRAPGTQATVQPPSSSHTSRDSHSLLLHLIETVFFASGSMNVCKEC